MDPSDPGSASSLIAGYPLWLVILVAGIALALVCWLLSKTLRVFAAIVVLAVIVGACVVAWQHVFR